MPTDRLTLTATTDPLTADTARTLGIALVQAAAAAGQTLRLTSTEGRSTVAQELAKARARVAELELQVAAVLALHQPIGHPKDQLCSVCMRSDWGVNAAWPCPTMRALDAAHKESASG